MTEKWLIIGPAWVGDMVMMSGLVRLLARERPEAELHVLAPGATASLLNRMPEVAMIHVLPFAHGQFAPWRRYQFGRRLRQHHFTHAIVIPGSWKSALIPWAAHIPERIGWLGEQRYGLLTAWRRCDKARYPTMMSRLWALALQFQAFSPNSASLPMPRLHVSAAQREAVLAHWQLSTASPALVMAPGAEYGPSKRWPVARFAAVASAALAAGWQVWLLGASGDVPLAEAIQEITQHRCVNLMGKTRLEEAVDLIASAAAMVGNDSGLMHVANALAVPAVVIYGSSSPTFTPPLSKHATVLQAELACRPCFKRTCPLGHLACMDRVSVAEVVKALPLN